MSTDVFDEDVKQLLDINKYGSYIYFYKFIEKLNSKSNDNNININYDRHKRLHIKTFLFLHLHRNESYENIFSLLKVCLPKLQLVSEETINRYIVYNNELCKKISKKNIIFINNYDSNF
jgi:hypothetical protein